MPDQVAVPNEFPTLESSGFQTNYLKIGDEIFSIKKVGHGVDVEKQMRAFYKAKEASLRKFSQEAVAIDIGNDQKKQLDRIKLYRTKGSVSIPNNLMPSMVAFVPEAGEVCKVVPIVYSPWRVIGTKAQFADFKFGTKGGSFTRFKAEDEIQVDIKCPMNLPAAVGISLKTKKLYMMDDFWTPHTMNGRYLCIGNSKFENWAVLDSMQMSTQVSIINLFSLARRSVKFMHDHGSKTIALVELFKMCSIEKIQAKEATWNM